MDKKDDIIRKINEEKENLKLYIESLKKNLQSTKIIIERKDNEIGMLTYKVNETDKEKLVCKA